MKQPCLFQWGSFLQTFMIEMPVNCWFSFYVAKGKFRCCSLLSSMLQQTDVWERPKHLHVFGWRAAGVERSGADPRFGYGSKPSQVWLEMLGWSGSNLLFCLVGGMRYGMDDSFHSVSVSHVS
jgi:hypothetical protein